jgi:hypothetical protein
MCFARVGGPYTLACTKKHADQRHFPKVRVRFGTHRSSRGMSGVSTTETREALRRARLNILPDGGHGCVLAAA